MKIKYYGDTKYYYVVLNGVEVLSLTKKGLKETIKVFKSSKTCKTLPKPLKGLHSPARPIEKEIR